MLLFEAKLEGTNEQYQSLDEAIRTARFVRNACLRYWMDNRDIGSLQTPKVGWVKRSATQRSDVNVGFRS